MAGTIPIDDPRLNALVVLYATAAKRLETALSSMLVAEGPRKFLIFQRIIRILEDLQGRADAWSSRFIKEFLEDADLSALTALRAAGISAPQFGASISESAVAGIALSLTNDLSKAGDSVRFLAQRIFRVSALEREFPALALQAKREVGIGLAGSEATAAIRGRIGDLLREQFQDGVVTIIASNGRRMSFPLDFYAGMVAQNTRRQAESFATLERARQGGHDLVRVTPNPSKGGDWCDAYRGRVYSISGASDIYPPLAGLPNAGPPFHPWCKHSLGVYIPSLETDAANREAANTDPRFLMQPGEENPNKVIREWWKADREDSLPTQIRFA